MFTEKQRRFPLIEAIIAFVLFLFHYTNLIDITIFGASPFILIPLCAAVGIFFSETTGLFFGLICGMACDSVAGNFTCFNTIALMLIGFFVGIFAKNIFSRNWQGAFALALISSFIYYGIYFILEFVINDVQGKVDALLYTLVPSAFYTSLFIFPFYFLEKALLKGKRKKNKLL